MSDHLRYNLIFNQPVGTIYMSVWDGSAWSVYKSNSSSGLTKEFTPQSGPGGISGENKTFVIQTQDPGNPSGWRSYQQPNQTFANLRTLIAESNGVLDLGGVTFSTESSDLDLTDSVYGAPLLTGVHTIKNGTIIGGRRSTWTEVSSGIYESSLVENEITLLSKSPQSYLYDENYNGIVSFASYPLPPEEMIPRSTLTYNTNWWYITKQNETAKGIVYTYGRKIKITGSFPADGSDELNSLFSGSSIVYSDGNSESTALSKGDVYSWNPTTKELDMNVLYYRNNTSEEFVYDKRSYNQQDAVEYPSFNVGDIITDSVTNETYTITESTLENVKFGQIYGFKITDSTFLSEFSNYVSDIGVNYRIFDRSGANTIGVSVPKTWDSNTGVLLYDENITNTSYSGSYYEFSLIGNAKILNSFPSDLPCYTFDLQNGKVLYKPQNSNPTGAYIPNMPICLFYGSGITFENMKFISGAYDGRPGTTPGFLRRNITVDQTNIINCEFRQNAYSIRFTGSGKCNLVNTIFSDIYERAISGFVDGSTADGNMFAYIQSRSAIFASSEPRTPNTTPVEKTTFKNNFVYMPAAIHGQGLSLYIDSWQNADVRHNIFYNTLRAMSMQPQNGQEQIAGGGHLKIENNLIFADNFLYPLPGGQRTIAFNGISDSFLPDGGGTAEIKSNTVYARESLLQGEPYSVWAIYLNKMFKTNVYCANNFAGGIIASERTNSEGSGEDDIGSLPHQYTNNFAQEASIEYGNSHSANDLNYPSGVSLDILFDFESCSMTGDLKTAATDGGAIGIRWTRIPNRTELQQILDNEDLNWHQTYPEADVPVVASESYSDAYFNEDLRPPL